MIVPVASFAGLRPPTVLLILNHQLLQLLVILLVGKSAGFVTSFDLGVTAVCFLKIHFLLLRPVAWRSLLSESCSSVGKVRWLF
jgi:hypothetical protein